MKGNKVSPHTVGVAVGGVVTVWHLVWATLVAGGYAQDLLDWIYSLHFLDNPFVVGEFNLGTAVALVIVTFVAGYAFGWVLGSVWNWARKK